MASKMTASGMTSFQWSTGSWEVKAIDRLIDGSLFDDLAQILRFGRRKFPHCHLIEDDEIELGEFCAIPKVGPAGTGDGEVLLERGDAHIEHRFAAGTGVQANRLSDERFADTGFADEQQRTGVVEPSERVDFLDLGLRD